MSAHLPALPLEADPLIAEAKRRARRRRLIAAGVLLLAAGGAAAGVLAFGGSGSASPGRIPWLPTRPHLWEASVPLAPACTASQLHASVSLQGATQSLVGPISIVNRSSRPCSLLGRPRLSFADATSKWQETRLSQAVGAPYDPLAPPHRSLRALAPGEHVSVMLWWSNWCGVGARIGGSMTRPPAAIVLTPPGGGQVMLSHAHLVDGLGAPVCNGGEGSLSTLGAGDFRPYVPQGPPSSELPLRARIVSGVFKAKPPSFVARPGAWFSYTVVLTNRSGKVFRFGRSCPSYVEGFGRPQAYVLNCRPVGSIGPGKSVRFAMRLHVPRHVSSTGPAFNWTLAPHSWNAPQAMGVVTAAS
jgi:Domain of unknown function (DUF4232)